MEKSFESIDKSEFRGLVRRIDRLARLCVPKEFRDSLQLAGDEKVKYFAYADGVLVKPANKANDEAVAVHHIDKLGRICIPYIIRNRLLIENHDSVEIFLLQDGLFVRKKQ